jgi:FixJ family two-component response regulator
VITDVQMPGISGVELQKRLSAEGYQTQIIFVTAYPDELTRARVLRDGALGYLSKPLQNEQLLHYLNMALHPGNHG